ncbi:MAG: Gfo/Idh/MocA family oxidoreductase [candidate division Zixibacteria bacterium]|nr:Gfo/Idh/MocA family oxidoreductase [candidate division Zixibacteria bacterium]
MNRKICWGILGTGSIAHKFATGLLAVPDAELTAVGSRNRETAETFGTEFGVPRRYACYEDLTADKDIDIVYISTLHPLHHPNTLMALNAGKAVLCEKPFSIHVRQAEEMVSLARSRGLFLMEAMWTRYLPTLIQVRKWLSDGVIGKVRMLSADFGFRAGFDPNGRLFNPALGGGGLLDVGVYPVSLASMVFGTEPARLTGLADVGTSGVDEQAAWVFGYEDGALAVLSSAVRTSTPHEATIMGEKGRIRIESPFWNATSAVLSVEGKEPLRIEPPRTGNGYNYEAAEAGRLLVEGKNESDIMPLDETLSIMRTMDALRAEWHVRYPMDDMP